MDPNSLQHLLDHPTPDADAPRNPVLTRHVMERVHQATTKQQVRATDRRSLMVSAVLFVLLAIGVSFIDLDVDGGFVDLVTLFDGEVMVELVIGSLIAAFLLALSWRKLV